MELSFERERQPLAARMRPRSLEEFIGQDHIIGHGRLLRRAIEADQLQSIILSGPPGSGKTTLARVVAERTRSQFLSINAVLAGVKDIRRAIEQAQEFVHGTNRKTLLFVDEVHRWNKSQQDALLPWVENGLVVLIGATTENPFFEVNRALLSRSRVFLLTSLTEQDLERVMDAALADRERGYGEYHVTVDPEARKHLVSTAAGDARTLLNALELAVETGHDRFPPPPGSTIAVDLKTAEDSIQRRAVLYDKDGDYHFDTISAFIKSVRGSDPDAALYWLARMITAGEDPRYILRRLLILAAEDVGLADPQALVQVSNCAASFDRVGLPEGQFHLVQATLYCSNAPKSNSALGYFDALKAVQSNINHEVPDHLRDPSRDGADLGHGRDYLYPHAYRDHWVAQQYLPESLQGNLFYQPGDLGWEGERKSVLAEHRRLQQAVEEEQRRSIFVATPGQGRGYHWLQRLDEGVLQEALVLRDEVLRFLEPGSTDRVLLQGAPLQLFLWEVQRRTTGGLTSAWCSDPRDLEAIRHQVEQSPLPAVERPQVTGVVRTGSVPPEDEAFRGPFDRILYRPDPSVPEDNSERNPGSILEHVLSLITPTGRVLVLEVIPLECSRPSTVLQLPRKHTSILDRAERAIFDEREPLWTDAVRAHEVDHVSSFHRIRTTTKRRVSPDIVRKWLEDDTPLAAEIIAGDGEHALQALRSAADKIVPGEHSWERTFLAVLVDSRHRAAPERC